MYYNIYYIICIINRERERKMLARHNMLFLLSHRCVYGNMCAWDIRCTVK